MDSYREINSLKCAQFTKENENYTSDLKRMTVDQEEPNIAASTADNERQMGNRRSGERRISREGCSLRLDHRSGRFYKERKNRE